MVTAMLDTNIIDKFLQDTQFLQTVNSLINQGKLKVFITGVLKNQVRQTPDETRREQLQQIVEKLKAEYLPVEFAPYGYAYGECYGGLSPDVTLDRNDFLGGNNKQIEDAMIAATASSKKYELEYVVTDDVGFAKRLNRQDVPTRAITFEQFRQMVQVQITNVTATFTRL